MKAMLGKIIPGSTRQFFIINFSASIVPCGHAIA
jgi:hypothetical protein